MKPRLLAVATALFVAGPLALAVVPADAAGAHPAPFTGTAARGTVVAPMAMSGPAGSATPARRATQWPVRTRTSTLVRANNTTPTGDASQQFTSVSMVQDLKYGALSVDIHLGAAPTTNSDLRFGFGTITTDSSGNKQCSPDSSAYEDINSMDVDSTGTSGNPSYDGAHIVVKPFRWAPAQKATWGCFYTVMLGQDSSGATTTYDAWIGGFTDHIQKTELTIEVANRKLSSRRFTKVPVTIANSSDTIATATNTELTWRTKGVTLRGNHHVGTIAPGHARKGFLLIKGSRSGSGSVVLTVRSGDYHHTLRLTVHPVAR